MAFSAKSGARLPDARVLWVVDPIDGTSCFLNGLHTGACRWRSSPTANRSSAWSTTPTIASCFTPCGGAAQRRSDPSAPATTVKEGVMGVGTSHRVTPADFLPFLQALLSDGGMFIRNGSGALMSARRRRAG